jgi:hypothetical protein
VYGEVFWMENVLIDAWRAGNEGMGVFEALNAKLDATWGSGPVMKRGAYM